MELVLLCGEEYVRVKRSWADRWLFLQQESDAIECACEWRQLTMWVTLNELMDSQPVRDYPMLPLSELEEVIRVMTPLDDSYLLYCHIDASLPEHTRREKYEALGRVVRGGPRPHYLMPAKRGLHFNFRLDRDPAYRTRRTSARLNCITGILQQAYYYQHSDRRPCEDSEWVEVPWYLINWNDVALFASEEATLLDGVRGPSLLFFVLSGRPVPSNAVSDLDRVVCTVSGSQVHIPNFPLLWHRLLCYIQKGDVTRGDLFGFFRLFVSGKKLNDRVSYTRSLHLGEVVCMLTERVVRGVSEVDACRDLRDTLGVFALRAYSFYLQAMLAYCLRMNVNVTALATFCVACGVALAEGGPSEDFVMFPHA